MELQDDIIEHCVTCGTIRKNVIKADTSYPKNLILTGGRMENDIFEKLITTTDYDD